MVVPAQEYGLYEANVVLHYHRHGIAGMLSATMTSEPRFLPPVKQIVYHHSWDVVGMCKVPPHIWNCRNRDPGRDSPRADRVFGPRMGMVAFDVMAGHLDMDCRYTDICLHICLLTRCLCYRPLRSSSGKLGESAIRWDGVPKPLPVAFPGMSSPHFQNISD